MKLEIKDIHKKFNKLEVLKGISFDVSEKEIIAIIGKSGGGKSTLLRCINKLEVPTSGHIYFNGKKDYNIDKFRQKVTMVFQNFNLFNNLTVLENMTLAPVREKLMTQEVATKKALALLEEVDLLDKKNVYPSSLSGGQKQRIAIVRALILDPEVILFDEPTSALDPQMTKEVLELIKKLAVKGMTMIVVSHEMEFVREVATKIIFVDEGKIAEIGTPKEVFEKSKNESLKALLGE